MCCSASSNKCVSGSKDTRNFLKFVQLYIHVGIQNEPKFTNIIPWAKQVYLNVTSSLTSHPLNRKRKKSCPHLKICLVQQYYQNCQKTGFRALFMQISLVPLFLPRLSTGKIFLYCLQSTNFPQTSEITGEAKNIYNLRLVFKSLPTEILLIAIIPVGCPFVLKILKFGSHKRSSRRN